MKFLALENAVPDIDENRFTQDILRRESARAWELVQQGIFREIYFRSDRQEAVIMMECDSLPAAREALNSLPLLKAGLIAFDVAPLVPYNGFARLFGSPA